MPIREHEAIAQRPVGVAGIEAQMLVPDLECGAGQAHRRTRVAAAGTFDRVDGKEADRVLDTFTQLRAGFGHQFSDGGTGG